jgi:anti-sigma-K factor RskA
MDAEERKCLEIEPLLAAYALEALEADEHEAVENHLADCLDCQRELEGFRTVSEGLLHVPIPRSPANSLRAGLIAKTASQSPKDRSTGTWLDRIKIHMPSQAVGFLLILLLITNGVLLSQSLLVQREIQEIRARDQVNQIALALSNSTSVQVVEVAGDGPNGTFLHNPDSTMAVLYLWDLEQLPSDRVYQAWLISPDGSRTSGGLLQPDPSSDLSVLLIQSPQPLSTYTGFGITVEPQGVSPGPTGPRILGAEL